MLANSQSLRHLTLKQLYNCITFPIENSKNPDSNASSPRWSSRFQINLVSNALNLLPTRRFAYPYTSGSKLLETKTFRKKLQSTFFSLARFATRIELYFWFSQTFIAFELSQSISTNIFRCLVTARSPTLFVTTDARENWMQTKGKTQRKQRARWRRVFAESWKLYVSLSARGFSSIRFVCEILWNINNQRTAIQQTCRRF